MSLATFWTELERGGRKHVAEKLKRMGWTLGDRPAPERFDAFGTGTYAPWWAFRGGKSIGAATAEELLSKVEADAERESPWEDW